MKKLKFFAETPIYTTSGAKEHKAWRMEDAQAALQTAYARGKPVVVFVHGRGKEPNKSFRGATWAKGLAVWKLERGYDCTVVMFNWNSAFPGIRFKDRSTALEHTGEGGKRFVEFLRQLQQFEASHPEMAKPVLLTHSMGSIVLQRSIADEGWPGETPLFQQVVFSQPDADDVGHRLWLGKLGDQEKVYLTFNADDHVLQKSTDDRPDGAKALGLGTTEPLAANITYVDLTSMGELGSETDDDHEVFGKGAMNGQLNVCTFFDQAILGKKVVLDASNIESIDRDVVYKLKPRFGENAPCLRIPKLPEFEEDD